jgi:predicted molibdopterin-dependent oxidoreductase YjgC
VVEVQGARVLAAACVAPAAAGMQVLTRSERVERSRRTLLEMLAASVDLSETPDVLDMLAEYRANPQRFPEAGSRQPALIDDNPMYVRDYAKCILCWRCVQVCADDAQYAFAINFSGRGYQTQIGTFFDRPMPQTTCVFCGQCVGVCPSGALKPRREHLLEQGLSPAEIASQGGGGRRRKGAREAAG